MRVFYAIEFQDDVKRYLKDVQDIVKSTTVCGNYTHYTNFHLTLRYVGNIYNGEFEELCQVLDDVSGQTTPFRLRIGDIGVFNKKNKSIVWVGVTKGKRPLKDLVHELEKEIVLSGFEPEARKYRPHVTLGKGVIFSGGSFTNGLPYYDKDIEVQAITLFQSHRVDGVLTYTPLYRSVLSGE